MSKIYRVSTRPGDWWLVPGDIHFPTQDQEALDAMMAHWEARRDEVMSRGGRCGIGLQGDTMDMWGVSSFHKSAQRLWASGKIQSEVRAARPFLAWCGENVWGLPPLYLLGNHEKRLRVLLDDYPALDGLPGSEFSRMLGLDDLGFEFIDHGGRILLGRYCVVAHGDELTGWRRTKSVANNYPDQVTVYGHTHHISSYLRTFYGPDNRPHVRGAYNIGHLSLRPEYYADPDWQLGFAEIEFHSGKLFTVHQRQLLRDHHGNYQVA